MYVMLLVENDILNLLEFNSSFYKTIFINIKGRHMRHMKIAKFEIKHQISAGLNIYLW